MFLCVSITDLSVRSEKCRGNHETAVDDYDEAAAAAVVDVDYDGGDGGWYVVQVLRVKSTSRSRNCSACRCRTTGPSSLTVH